MSALVTRRDLAVGLGVAALFVVLGTFLFGYSMETLDVKAEDLGIEAGEAVFPSPFPEYVVPGMETDAVNLVLGLVSTLLVFGVAWGVLKALAK
jgi:hypothetical protein